MIVDLNGVSFVSLAHRYFDKVFTLDSSICHYSGLGGMGNCEHVIKVQFVGLGNLTVT